VPLDGPAKLQLWVDHHYRIVRPTERGPYKVQTAAYYYALEDQDGREILAYHWHPSQPQYPHLHVGPGAVDSQWLAAVERSPQTNALRPDLMGAHLPTGRIALEDVVELVLDQFQVAPKRARHWRQTLTRSRAAFERTRTWHDRSPP
jgi:hypothetical protein